MQAMTKDWALVVFSAVQVSLFVGLSTLLYPTMGLMVIPISLIGVNLLFALSLQIYTHYALARTQAISVY
jgi:hypothetical protein